MQTLSGSLIGKDDNVLVVVNDAGSVEKSMRIKGRYYYVKKCIKAGEVHGITIPHKSRMDHPFGLVLAVGDQCGKPAKLSKQDKRRGISKGQGFRLKPMTMILMPDDSNPWFIKPSPYSEGETVERLIHEDIIKCVVEEPHNEK